MSENYSSESQENENHDSNEKTEVINDEVLEHIYEDLNQLRELAEQDRETTQAMRQLISDLKTKVDRLEAALKTKLKTKGE